MGIHPIPKDPGNDGDRSRLALEALMTITPDAIIMIDKSGTIQAAGQAVKKMFGYKREELVGRNVSILMPPSLRDEHDGHIARFLETGEAHIIGKGRTWRPAARTAAFFLSI